MKKYIFVIMAAVALTLFAACNSTGAPENESVASDTSVFVSTRSAPESTSGGQNASEEEGETSSGDGASSAYSRYPVSPVTDGGTFSW